LATRCVQHQRILSNQGALMLIGIYRSTSSCLGEDNGCSLKIHRVENQRCWWKAHIRKGLVRTVPPATYF